ncbi:MAG: PD-(D/E)XK nuclease family protein [Gallionellaceae bacterium]|nr:PD-(D/E)XK nuclease family protein [Gallionellaceae bacterium]
MEPHPHNALSAVSLLQQFQEMRSVKHSSSLSLVEAAKEIIARRHESLRVNSLRLIESAKPRIATIEKERHDNASFFNVFAALGVVRKEVIQSRFLAYLLSPNQEHNQGIIFLEAFLGKLDIQISNIAQARVVAERSAGDGLGRMDIVIDCKPSLIVIENKIDAGEGVEQLPRYRKWLDQQRGYDGDKKHLIFLTPTGHESVTGKTGAYQQFSYSDLADALAELLEKQSIIQPSVREVFCQYVSICKSIGGEDMTTQDKELQELLTKPENIMAALEMEQQTAIARKAITKQFSKNIVKIIQGYIESDESIRTGWRTTLQSFEDGYSNILIQTLSHNAKPSYQLLAKNIFTNKMNDGWFGWYRPKSVDINKHCDTLTLTEKMVGSGSEKAEDWWVGWNYLRDGQYGIMLSNNEDIFECFEDNRNQEHPLAKNIADEIWQMFTAYRADVEALPSFQQAATL